MKIFKIICTNWSKARFRVRDRVQSAVQCSVIQGTARFIFIQQLGDERVGGIMCSLYSQLWGRRDHVPVRCSAIGGRWRHCFQSVVQYSLLHQQSVKGVRRWSLVSQQYDQAGDHVQLAVESAEGVWGSCSATSEQKGKCSVSFSARAKMSICHGLQGWCAPYRKFLDVAPLEQSAPWILCPWPMCPDPGPRQRGHAWIT